MTRQQLLEWVEERFSVEPDYPWQEDSAVLRHPGSRKWFGVLMQIPRSRLGLPGEEKVDVLNVKCDPLLIGILRQKPGIHPAYHMNREHWLSLRLDGSASREDICFLLEESWNLTLSPQKR